MNTTETKSIPGFRRSHMAAVKGSRTRHVVTMNPNKAYLERNYVLTLLS